MRALVTGGAGFIGSALCLALVRDRGADVLNVDKLGIGSNLASLSEIEHSTRYTFLQADVCDGEAMAAALEGFRPTHVFHLAAETHVDRSIDGALPFIETNVVGTQTLLDAVRSYWQGLASEDRDGFRFVHVSTDEVFGALGDTGIFTEDSPYDPSSPYSASKAAADHLVRAAHRTHGLPVLVSNCSNNYGPRQFPEKLIPLMILKARAGEALPVYGDGQQVRDWLHVEDHVAALLAMATDGRIGETYCVGGEAERTNLAVIDAICARLDQRLPAGAPHLALIEHVADRPGHDRRYAVDPAKLKRDLGWAPSQSFETGLAETVDWYLGAEDWWGPILTKRYGGERLGRGS